jgi:hypothetical protein
MSSAVEKLAELEEAASAAKGREDQVVAARSRAARAATAAEAALEMYHEAVGAGEDEDAVEEERLRVAVRNAREQAEPAVWAAKVTGAQRAREQVEEERDTYGHQHFAEIAAEEAPKDEPARERLEAAYAELEQAEAAYAARVRRSVKLAPYGGLDVQTDCPRLPTAGSPDEVRSRFAAGIPAATPWPLRRAVEEQAA